MISHGIIIIQNLQNIFEYFCMFINKFYNFYKVKIINCYKTLTFYFLYQCFL